MGEAFSGYLNYGFRIGHSIPLIGGAIREDLGASYADWLSQPAKRGGLGLGSNWISLILTLAIVALVGFMSARRSGSRPQAAGALSRAGRASISWLVHVSPAPAQVFSNRGRRARKEYDDGNHAARSRDETSRGI